MSRIEDGFVQGQSDNLPKIDSIMMAEFLQKNSNFMSAEIRGVKAERSTRESYGDNAVGYVQIKRDGDICTVKGKITPEHKVHKTAYPVSVSCNEKEEVVLSATCEGCVASQGGCKHVIAFLAWIHRRSEDPSSTSIQCYWKKSSLSSVGGTVALIKAKDLGKKSIHPLPDKTGEILQDFAQKCEEQNINDVMLLHYICSVPKNEKLSLHSLHSQFIESGMGAPPEEFLKFVQANITSKMCDEVAKATKEQYDSPLWHELRYGRITASKFHAAAHCKTLDGSLVESILGAKLKDTAPMKRGRELESKVLKVLRKKVSKKIDKCGLFIDKDYPFFGASPDGIGDDFIVEIKCPSSDATMKNYFKNNQASEKSNAQMQLQMALTKKPKALFCVAHPDFEITENITEMWLTFNNEYFKTAISQCFKFWCEAVYPRL